MKTLLALTMTLCLVGVAQADVLYDTLGYGWDSSGGWLIGDMTNIGVDDASFASRFQIDGDELYDISTVTLSLSHMDDGYSPDVNVELLTNDETGRPGEILATASVNLAASATHFRSYEITFDGLNLAGSTDYWIAVTPTDTTEDTYVLWAGNTYYIEGPCSGREGASGFEWDEPFEELVPQFLVEGTLIPEPATLSLLGLAGLVCLRRRR